MSTDSMMVCKARGSLGSFLEHLLVEECRLAAATREYCCGTGLSMRSFSRLLAEQERQIASWINDLSELGARAGLGFRCRDGATLHARQEFGSGPAGMNVVLRRHETIAQELRTEVETLAARDPDGDAAFLLSGLREFHETSAWMLRSLLGGGERRRRR